MHIPPSFKPSPKVKKLELSLKHNCNLLGTPSFFVGDMNIDLLKQKNLSGYFSSLLHYIGTTQVLSTETINTIDSAFLIDYIFRNDFFDTSDYGVLDASSTDDCATFVKFTFS